MRLRRVSSREYLCCDDESFSISLVDGWWRISASGSRMAGRYASRLAAATVLASMLREWRTAV
jgi:hypothetical protein